MTQQAQLQVKRDVEAQTSTVLGVMVEVGEGIIHVEEEEVYKAVDEVLNIEAMYNVFSVRSSAM